MGYGSRKYGRAKQDIPEQAVPTFVCNHCSKIKQLTSKTISLTGVMNNALFLSCRICDDCGKLLQEWFKK